MTPHWIPAVLSPLFGLAMGMAVRHLLRLRAGESDPTSETAPPLPGADAPAPAAETAGTAPGVLGPAWLHPLVLAAASGALALLPALRDPLALSQALLLLYLLYPLALVDLVTLTVEPGVVLGGMVLRLAAVLVLYPAQALEMMGGLLGGAGLLTVVGFAYQWLRGREGLGEGDPLVLGLVGAFVGWGGILPVVLLATVAGLAVGLPALLLLRRPLHTPLPFAPFLCLAGLAVYLGQLHGLRFFGFLPPLG